MTALANLSALVASWRREADDMERAGVSPSTTLAIRANADELDAAIATLSPAELGGVEAVAVADCDGRFVEIKALTPAYGLPVGKHNLYTTPRAAEAPTVSLADIGLCKWAAHILSDPERFNARANDASAAIGRLVAALTPPSAKGENK